MTDEDRKILSDIKNQVPLDLPWWGAKLKWLVELIETVDKAGWVDEDSIPWPDCAMAGCANKRSFRLHSPLCDPHEKLERIKRILND